MTFKQTSDVSLCPREERSHGYCTTGTDPDIAICTWTEGNTQPQRDGTWMAAIDLTQDRPARRSTGRSRSTARSTLTGVGTHLLDARDARPHHEARPDDRATSSRPTTIIWRSGDVRGNNNTNNGKGGTYYGNNMAVIKADQRGHHRTSSR